MPTTITVKQFLDPDKLKADLAFSVNDLSSAMMEQSAILAYYGVLAAQAAKQVDLLKLALENKEAALYQRERKQSAVSGEKLTETMLEKRIAVNAEIIKLKIDLSEAKRIEATTKIAVESFRHRRDMLVQLGLIEREEMKGELRIMAKQDAQNVVESAKARELDRLRNRNSNAAQE